MFIPLGVANFKLMVVALWPFGREIVPVEVAERMGGAMVTVPAERPSSSPGRR